MFKPTVGCMETKLLKTMTLRSYNRSLEIQRIENLQTDFFFVYPFQFLNLANLCNPLSDKRRTTKLIWFFVRSILAKT